MVLLLIPSRELKADGWIMAAPIVQCQCQCWPLAAGGLGRHVLGSWSHLIQAPGSFPLNLTTPFLQNGRYSNAKTASV